MKRLLWLDIAKGLAILYVVYFHFFTTYFEHGSLPPENWNGLAASATTILGIVWLKVSGLGFHAVGAFIILSGWVLMQSTASRAASAPVTWGKWYRARLLRLYPMYWVAHLVYLVSPFVARFEQVDSRIVLSLLGLRFVDITMNFMYLNAAWWYFSMLIQLLPDFSAAFLGGAPARAMDFSVRRVCHRIFRALRVAHPLAATWIVVARRLRHFPAA